MIYSNFPHALHAVSNRATHNYLNCSITIGDNIGSGNYLPLYCTENVVIEKGLNEMLDFAHSKNSTIVIKQYEKDPFNYDDPNWKVSDELFLLLTSNVNDATASTKGLCRTGLVRTLEKDAYTGFCLYRRIMQELNKKHSFMFGIYRVKTSKPCIVKISPPDSETNQFLVINKGKVVDFPCMNKVLDSLVRSLGISNDIVNEQWATL